MRRPMGISTPTFNLLPGPTIPYAQKTWPDLSFVPSERPRGPAWVRVGSRGAATCPCRATTGLRGSSAYKTIFCAFLTLKIPEKS